MASEFIIFDLNGTLLDMSALDEHFQRIFSSADFREKWFAQLQALWMTTIASETFQPFQKLAKAALQMLAAKESIELAQTDEAAVLAQMIKLPPYDDVPAGLEQLVEAGYRLVALTNGSQASAKKQLKFAQIGDSFEQVFGADQVERYKPAPEPYLYVGKQLRVKPAKLLLVAAHAWDIEGASQAGLQTAFVERPRQVLNPSGTKPDYRVADVTELAKKLS
jgi:2-haloacid dehalogenase